MEPDEDFIVPPAILHQVNEFTTGGFLLLVFDEDGSPQIKVQMDSATHVMAMETFLNRWLSVIDETQKDMMMSNGLQALEEEIEEDIDDEEDED